MSELIGKQARLSCRLEFRGFNSFRMFLKVMQWSNHCVPWQIDLVGVVFGFRPRFCLCLVWFLVWFAAFSDETQVWLGDLRVVVVCCLDLPARMDQLCPCTNIFSQLMLM